MASVLNIQIFFLLSFPKEYGITNIYIEFTLFWVFQVVWRLFEVCVMAGGVAPLWSAKPQQAWPRGGGAHR